MAAERVDVLIVVAQRGELDAVLAQGTGQRRAWTEAHDSTGATYFRCEEPNARGQTMRIAAAWLGDSGQEAATMRSRRLVDELDPACLANCGVCAGRRGAVGLGDVIVAERVVPLEGQGLKTRNEVAGEERYVFVGDGYELDIAWRTNAAVLAGDQEWSGRLSASRPPALTSQVRWLLRALLDQREDPRNLAVHREDRKKHCPNWSSAVQRVLDRGDGFIEDHGTLTLTPSGLKTAQEERILHPDDQLEEKPFQVHLGTLATATNVIKDADFFPTYASLVRKLLGVDLESSAIASVATHLGRRWLVFRGVADFADGDKDDSLRDFTAQAAAASLFAFLTRYFDTGARATPPSDRPEDQLSLPVIVERIEISGFKNIDQLALDPSTGSKLDGRWTCLAGINGAGKTSILQAIALVLLGDKLAEQLGSVRLARMVRSSAGSSRRAEITATVRVGAEVMKLSLPLSADGIDSDRLDSYPNVKEMRAFWEKRARRGILATYGASRNLSEYVDNRHESLHLEVQRQMSLFDPMARVARAELLFSREERLKPILRTLRRILTTVLSDLPISMSPDEDSLRFLIDGADLPPSALPDGFRSTITWLGDLCATWHDKAPAGDVGDGDPARIHGVVLVDEVDLHLHPGFQRVLVPRLREAMPRVQWIVTTHSPLVLASFDRNEIKMLDSTEPGGVRELDRDILGFTTDQIYGWLMDTKPRGIVLEELLAHANGAEASPERQRDLAVLVASTPDFNEADAQRRVAWRQDLLARIRRDASSPPTTGTLPDETEKG